MPGARTTTARSELRGRIDKREAILHAAFTVFARSGFDAARMEEIAAEARVAKLTLYNHFGDKDRLFVETLGATAEAVLADNLAALDRLRNPEPDLRAAFDEVAFALLRSCCDDRSRALRRLTYGQVVRFPELIDSVPGRTSVQLGEALADRIARLSMAGQLRTCDPVTAAGQLLAMLVGPIEGRSRMGTRTVPKEEIRAVSDAAVDTFLRAYGADA